MKNKRRIFGIVIGLALVTSLLFGGVAFAADPTTVDVTWSGVGSVDGEVNAGDDAVTYFHSEGSNHAGEFHAIDNNDNPYGYGVDSCSFSLETAITGTGWATLNVNRTDSTGMYGPAGQQSYTYVGVNSGSATLQNQSSTNYAAMKDCNYGWHANDHVTVTGASAYTIVRFMDNDSSSPGGTDSIRLDAWGSGDADLDCMSSSASGNGGVRLGCGCGCYTNAGFTATGIGTFQLQGMGDTTATTAMAPGMTGASSFNFIANWIGGSTFTVPDYSTTVN